MNGTIEVRTTDGTRELVLIDKIISVEEVHETNRGCRIWLIEDNNVDCIDSYNRVIADIRTATQ